LLTHQIVALWCGKKLVKPEQTPPLLKEQRTCYRWRRRFLPLLTGTFCRLIKGVMKASHVRGSYYTFLTLHMTSVFFFWSSSSNPPFFSSIRLPPGRPRENCLDGPLAIFSPCCYSPSCWQLIELGPVYSSCTYLAAICPLRLAADYHYHFLSTCWVHYSYLLWASID
jgi:hypothetical protein